MTTAARSFARRLCREQTSFEKALWHELRGGRLAGAKFRRQVPIAGYVVDFICLSRKLIVEVDGRQYDWEAAYDAQRSAALEGMGFRVVRFRNEDVRLRMPEVLARIAAELKPF